MRRKENENENHKERERERARLRKPTVGRRFLPTENLPSSSVLPMWRERAIRKTYLLLQFSQCGEREQLPEVAGRESGREKKRESGREKKIEAGREMVTNITYITIQISSKYHKIDLVIYVYRGVKTEEKRASPQGKPILLCIY